MRKRVPSVLSFVLAMLLFVCPALAVDTIYMNGTVVTMNGQEVVEAVAVTGDRIEAVGTRDEMLSLAEEGTRLINLEGRTMLPGFIDPHSHFPGQAIYAVFSVDLNSPPLGTITCFDELVDALKAKVPETAPGSWIRGNNYDDTLLAEMRHPDRYVLDRVSTEHPVSITHISGHLTAVNSKALELAGITSATPDPPGGHIQKDPVTGEPTGVLEEAAGGLIPAAPITPDVWKTGIEWGSEWYSRVGCTTVQSSFPLLDMFNELIDQDKCKVRVVFWISGGNPDALNASPLWTSHQSGTPLRDDFMLTQGAAKLIADGSIQGYTGYLSQPYYTLPADKPAGYRGYPSMDRAVLIDKVKKLHRGGWQIAIHGNGDAAIDDIIDAFAAAQAEFPRSDCRHVINHCQMGREDQLDRMKDLDIMASFFVLHTYYWGDRHWNIFMGPERAARMSPMRSALDRGIKFTHHTDDPVTPINPLLSVWAAVNRQSYGGNTIGAAQQIPVYEALRGVTIDAAFQHFEENTKGSIEPGKLADFVVLGDNPLEVDPMTIRDIPVVATIVADRAIYGADNLEVTTADGAAAGCFISSIISK